MPHTILVVDDESTTITLTSTVLEAAGYRVLKAYGGTQALDILERENPDLVLSDIMMPVIDGYDLLRRAREEGYKGPFVFMSAGKSEEEVKEKGAAAYLKKPFGMKALQDTVSSLIGEAEPTDL